MTKTLLSWSLKELTIERGYRHIDTFTGNFFITLYVQG